MDGWMDGWMNWIILKLINWISLDYDYNELNSNLLELDHIIYVR